MRTVLLPGLTLAHREILRFIKQRSRITGAFVTPLVLWLLIGSGVGSAYQTESMAPGTGYLAFFFPGTVLMIVLFTAIFSTVSIIEDRNEGFLQGVLVAPVSPYAIVLGKVLGGAVLAVVQALLFYPLALFVGLPVTVSSFVLMLPILALLSLALTALGYLVAWPMKSTQGYHAILNLFLFPLWLMSGALFSTESAHGWMRVVMFCNPLTYGLDALRAAMLCPCASMLDQPAYYTGVAVTTAFMAILIVLAAFQTEKSCRG